MTRIAAVGVVVPARDEEATIGACLRSVRVALDALPAGIATAVAVVLDRCTDRTPEEAVAATGPGIVLLRVAAPGRTARGPGPAREAPGDGVGALRELGVRGVLDRLTPSAPDRTWLLHTDADSTVPPDWALAHLDLAEAGAAAVAGLADLDAPPRAVPAGYQGILDQHRPGGPHRHVYGANLGVRADAHLAVGGFPVDGPGEDHGLWARLRHAGLPVVAADTGTVRTSARLDGRAAGGLADLLAGLHRGVDQTCV